MPGIGMSRAYEGDRPYIFVNYAHADKGVVLPIVRKLVDEGFRVWWDDDIDLTIDFPEVMADHVFGCDCLMMFVTSCSLRSVWCTRELEYALELDKTVLPIYLEDVELTHSLQLLIGHKQALRWHDLDTDEFYRRLFRAHRLESCLTDEGRRRRGVKPRDGGVSAAQQEAGRTASDQQAHATTAVSQPAPARTVMRTELRTDAKGDSRIKDGAKPMAEARPGVRVDKLAIVPGIAKRYKLADYSWDELKALSRAIAAAASDDEGLEIARAYGLVDEGGRLWRVDENGRPWCDEKPLALKDRIRASVRILGFRHDELVTGDVAGISFEFVDVPKQYHMNPGWTNAGGWERSEMRRWLNDEFPKLLPDDLRANVAEVRKRTNNTYKVGRSDPSCVTVTSDWLWLLSMPEVYGKLFAQRKNVEHSPATYDAEGTQYKLYADMGATVAKDGFSRKTGVDSWWWLRSPHVGSAYAFLFVDNFGKYCGGDADRELGVSPGFCF